MEEKAQQVVIRELVEAQTQLARMHFENWLTFLTFLRAHFKKIGCRSPAVEDDQSSGSHASLSAMTGAKQARGRADVEKKRASPFS